MLIWFDCNTPKDSLIFAQMGFRLKKLGHEVLFTAREYDCTIDLLKMQGIKPYIVGKYGGKDLKGKLIAYLNKSLNLVTLFENLGRYPDLSIHFASPEAARVAFGLGIKNVCFHDTINAIAVMKLTIPLVDALLLSYTIPKEAYRHLIPEDKIFIYNGIENLEYLRNIEGDEREKKLLGIDDDKIKILIRPEEAYAAYYLRFSGGEPLPYTYKIIDTLSEHFDNLQFIVLPRYEEQKRALMRIISEKQLDIVIPRRPIIVPKILPFIDMVLTGGLSIGIDAGLLGIPSVIYYPGKLAMDYTLQNSEFPFWHITNLEETIDFAMKILRNPDKYKRDTHQLLEKMELPSDKLIDILPNIFEKL
ncbi:MAG: DUF354 domain-containing protein [Candidatus Njordarchaeia archaeon]